MSFFDQAKGKLKDAVGDAAEGSVGGVRDVVQDVVKQQLEDLVGKAVVAMVASVTQELHAFAALHLATKEDVARLEALLVAATTADVPVVTAKAAAATRRPRVAKAS